MNEEILRDLSPVEILEDILEQITKREEDCLMRVYTRFCFLRGLPVDFNNVARQTYELNPNKWDFYWIMPGTEVRVFLMSRELIIEDSQPKLNIIFNPELLKED